MRFEHALLAVTTVSMGLIAGFFYAYACSVMIGLAQVGDRTFIEAMQAINASVRNLGFAPTFFGSLVLSLLAAGVLLLRQSSARWWAVAAVVLYAGAFAITLGISVPLNEQLAAVGPAAELLDPTAVRELYENPWVAWNLVRTLLSTAALGALIGGLLVVGRRAPVRRSSVPTQ